MDRLPTARVDTDYMSWRGAHVLRNKILTYWKRLGAEPTVVVSSVTNARGEGYFVVRSNIGALLAPRPIYTMEDKLDDIKLLQGWRQDQSWSGRYSGRDD